MGNKAGAALLVAVMAVSMAACSSSGTGSSGTTTAATETSGGSTGGGSTIKIGVISPDTGASSDPGQRVKEGATIARDTINASGGVNGQQVELVFADDASTPEQGVLKLKQQQADGVHFFTGTINSAVANAIGNFLVDSTDLYIMTAAQTNDPLTAQKNGNIFALSNTNAEYGKVFYPWILNNLKPKTLAVLAENSDYGNNEIQAMQSYLTGPDAPKIVTERFDRSQSDYSVQLTKLLAEKPDALYAIAAGTDLPAKILKQAKDLGFTGQGLSGPGTISGAFIQAGGSAVEGVISANVYSPTLDNAANKDFVSKFQAAYGRQPSAEAALGYDSVWTLVQAMEKSGSPTDPVAVAKTYRAGTWDTVRGQQKFDDTGRMINTTLIVKVENGSTVVVTN